MKFAMGTLLSFFTISSFAQEICNTDGAYQVLIETFQINDNPIDWQSVKKNTLRRNRAFPIVVFATNRISTSRIEYKRSSHSLENTRVCYNPEKNELSISHSRYGTLYIQRSGANLNSSLIGLRKNGRGPTIYLRPKDLVR